MYRWLKNYLFYIGKNVCDKHCIHSNRVILFDYNKNNINDII